MCVPGRSLEDTLLQNGGASRVSQAHHGGQPALPAQPQQPGFRGALQPAVREQMPGPIAQPCTSQVADQIANTPQNTRVRPPASGYSYCMISPIRGDFTGFRVQVPPRTHHDERLTCGYVMGRHSSESGTGCFRRSGPWGFKSGPGCGTATAIVSQTDLRILRDVPSRKPWPVEDAGRMRRGWMLVSGTRMCRAPGRLRPSRRHCKPVTVESADMSDSPRRCTDRRTFAQTRASTSAASQLSRSPRKCWSWTSGTSPFSGASAHEVGKLITGLDAVPPGKVLELLAREAFGHFSRRVLGGLPSAQVPRHVDQPLPLIVH